MFTFFSVPPRYLEMILSYLQGYAGRVKPVLDFPEEVDRVRKDFEPQWEAGTFPGWPVSIQFPLTSPYHVLTHLYVEYKLTTLMMSMGLKTLVTIVEARFKELSNLNEHVLCNDVQMDQ